MRRKGHLLFLRLPDIREETIVGDKIRDIGARYGILLILAVIAVPLGAAIGAIDVLFEKGLELVANIRNPHPWYFIPFLALAGIVIVFCTGKLAGKNARGMDLVFRAGQGEPQQIPLRLIPLSIAATWLTHLFGGSAGREGVAVQVGASISHWVGRKLPIPDAARILLVAGMAAGFSGMFGTPVAAVLFAMEVLVTGKLIYHALLPALTASFTACAVSKLLGLKPFTSALPAAEAVTPLLLLQFLILGAICGLAGGCFAWGLSAAHRLLNKKFPNPLIRVAIMGVTLSVLLLVFYTGRYSGPGSNLIQIAFGEGKIYYWDFALKGILTILTLAAGFQGGEVTPLCSIGACLGIILAPLFGIPAPIAAAVGYICVFGGGTNTFLAPLLIGGEVFGFQWLPFFFIACAAARLFSGRCSIYGLQIAASEGPDRIQAEEPNEKMKNNPEDA